MGALGRMLIAGVIILGLVFGLPWLVYNNVRQDNANTLSRYENPTLADREAVINDLKKRPAWLTFVFSAKTSSDGNSMPGLTTYAPKSQPGTLIGHDLLETDDISVEEQRRLIQQRAKNDRTYDPGDEDEGEGMKFSTTSVIGKDGTDNDPDFIPFDGDPNGLTIGVGEITERLSVRFAGYPNAAAVTLTKVGTENGRRIYRVHGLENGPGPMPHATNVTQGDQAYVVSYNPDGNRGTSPDVAHVNDASIGIQSSSDNGGVQVNDLDPKQSDYPAPDGSAVADLHGQLKGYKHDGNHVAGLEQSKILLSEIQNQDNLGVFAGKGAPVFSTDHGFWAWFFGGISDGISSLGNGFVGIFPVLLVAGALILLLIGLVRAFRTPPTTPRPTRGRLFHRH